MRNVLFVMLVCVLLVGAFKSDLTVVRKSTLQKVLNENDALRERQEILENSTCS